MIESEALENARNVLTVIARMDDFFIDETIAFAGKRVLSKREMLTYIARLISSEKFFDRCNFKSDT